MRIPSLALVGSVVLLLTGCATGAPPAAGPADPADPPASAPSEPAGGGDPAPAVGGGAGGWSSEELCAALRTIDVDALVGEVDGALEPGHLSGGAVCAIDDAQSYAGIELSALWGDREQADQLFEYLSNLPGRVELTDLGDRARYVGDDSGISAVFFQAGDLYISLQLSRRDDAVIAQEEFVGDFVHVLDALGVAH